MSTHEKHLSILSLPEVQDVYSVPKFSTQELPLYSAFTMSLVPHT